MEAAGPSEAKSGKQKIQPGTTTTDAGDRDTPKDEVISEEGEEEGEEEDDNEEDDEDDVEDEEPRLKYAPITPVLGPLYRNKDATSTFMTAGNKMIVGTHNGNIHVYSVPFFQHLRVYHAHSASIDSISISPFPPPAPTKVDFAPIIQSGGSGASVSESPNGSKPQPVTIPPTPSNSIYIATSSMDGNVCVASLVDPKDVTLRNFGRPVSAVALSPEYKSDRTYVSGGKSGNLVLTVGGRVGASSNATLGSASPTGWFGSLGLGGNNGKDRVLHNGEGAISCIKWSRSGKYVAWVNEEGIKIMRSHLHLEQTEAEHAWERFGHTDRPRSQMWDEMAGVWKPRVVWIDEDSLERENASVVQVDDASTRSQRLGNHGPEKLLVGWGGTIWIIKVSRGDQSAGLGKRRIASAEITTKLRTDCIISGVSLYTQNLLLVLSYIIPDDDDPGTPSKQAGPARGIRRRQNGLQPELRLIDIDTEEELSGDILSVRNYENLSASDYHLDTLPLSRIASTTHRGALESITAGLIDATLYPKRLFSSGTSSRSMGSSADKGSGFQVTGTVDSSGLLHGGKYNKEIEIAATAGVRVFIHSPYDCILAVKRGFEDRLAWLDSRERYEEAWELLKQNPDAFNVASGEGEESPPGTPTPSAPGQPGLSLLDNSSIQTTSHSGNTKLEQEKRRIGELWLKQLVGHGEWEKAGNICTRVLRTTAAWDHWICVFARNGKFDEITPHVPIDIEPPLPSFVYEVILGHYVSRDRVRFNELIELWPPNLFETDSVTAAIQDQLLLTDEGTEDWRNLLNCLAKLFLVGGHYREALRCYIKLQDGDAVMSLIREYHLLDSVSEDVPGFILLRVPKNRIKTAPTTELEEATSEPIKLLVREAANGIVRPETVVTQLQEADLGLFLYFYLRALWRGDFVSKEGGRPAIRARGHHRTEAEAGKLVADEGRIMIDGFADTVIELFANYDRPLLMEFLQSSTSYSYDTACSICERRTFTPELIYLLSKTGQTKRALQLILSSLNDISHAISFAKSQDDPDLWDDLLSYSMDKPEYIRALLTEASTAIDPIKLVKRIPSGLEIEGLREGLTRMIRDHDIQASISLGVAKVLAGEVAIRMDALRKGQRQGMKFDVCHDEDSAGEDVVDGQDKDAHPDTNGETIDEKQKRTSKDVTPGRCAGCKKPFVEQETETIVVFACGHIYHISHLHGPSTPEEQDTPQGQDPASPRLHYQPSSIQSSALSRTVGLKVTNARLLRDKIGDGCRICADSLKDTAQQ
ncbi:vacuolar assembly protein [Trichophyton violaceum]|uniref:Vacuolar assembly protein n=1 Tax=Trichophyton violaceum TaxID=34388 RepID=A0A178FMT7_TRIVO|nr:vacuolar assembly protein [Trichophyton violaceum]